LDAWTFEIDQHARQTLWLPIVAVGEKLRTASGA
jgi:hypothetical protein